MPPRFNRLVAFDPRIPHGVRRVEGTHDPREGRLVIHGWFVQPRPFIEGPLPVEELADRIAELPAAISEIAEELPIAGALCLGFTVTAAGKVTTLSILSDTTRVPSPYEKMRDQLILAVARTVASFRFSKRKGRSKVTLPIVFER